MRKKGILIVGLALMIAAAGVVYAHWFDTLTVDVEVATGNIDPLWLIVGTNDDTSNKLEGEYKRPLSISGVDPSGPGMTPTRYTKAVADCVAKGDGTYDSLTVTITNGYPSYWCTVSAGVANDGTVPVKLQSLFLNLPSEIDVTMQGVEFMACGYQLDPGEEIMFEMSFHVNNTALELTDYEFDLDLTWYNWNEWKVGGAGCPTVITSSLQNFSSTGWGGWSSAPGVCTAVLGGWLSPAVPGGTVYPYSGKVFVGPGTTPFGYTYEAGEMGFIVQNGGTPQSAYINYLCIPPTP